MSHAKLPHDLSARIKSASHDSPKSRSQPGPGNRELLSQLGGAKAMPEQIQSKMEDVLGSDFSGVRLYESPLVSQHGAQAAAAGNAVAFAPGKLNFSSRSGLELLGHELSHVASQARGEVSGSGFVHHAALEHKADADGAKTAAAFDSLSGQTLTPMSAGMSMPSASAPVQAKKKTDPEKEFIANYDASSVEDQVRIMRDLSLRVGFTDYSNAEDWETSTYLDIIHRGVSQEFMDELMQQQLIAAQGLANTRDYYANPATGGTEDKALFMADQSLARPLFHGFSKLLTEIGVQGPDDGLSYEKYQNKLGALMQGNEEVRNAMGKASAVSTYHSDLSTFAAENPEEAQDAIKAGRASFQHYLQNWEGPKQRKRGFFSRLFHRH